MVAVLGRGRGGGMDNWPPADPLPNLQRSMEESLHTDYIVDTGASLIHGMTAYFTIVEFIMPLASTGTGCI